MIYILGFVLGVIYRFSEIEYIWSKGTWRWNGLTRERYVLRDWVTPWMMGDIPHQVAGSWQWYFHRMTFSMFEDAYHFFRNLELIIYLFLTTYYITWFNVTMIILARYVGTQVGREMIIQKD